MTNNSEIFLIGNMWWENAVSTSVGYFSEKVRLFLLTGKEKNAKMVLWMQKKR